MKHKIRCKIITYIILLCMVVSLLPVTVYADPNYNSEIDLIEDTVFEIPENAIQLSTPEDILELAESCRVNSWSVGKTVVLANDIDMTGVEFSGIPTFGGVFIGQGNTISGISMKQKGSGVGFFRYLQKTAIVGQLNIEAILEPEGSKSKVGGLVGSNSGSITQCTFTGVASGYEKIGGIAGINEASGIIENCTTIGMVYGNHFVGGVAGENQGVIRKSSNYGEINTKSVQNFVSIEDITLDSMVNTEDARTTTDIGGVVGVNSGVVRACSNHGNIGYQSMGYNIGGVVGTQSGYVVSCINYAEVQGRKEVGGIVGHMEPNVVVDFDEDTFQTLSSQMSDLEVSMNALEGSIQDATQEVEEQMLHMEDNLAAVENSVDELTSSTEDFSESMETVMKAVEDYADAANALMDEIDKIAESDETIAIKNKIEEIEIALKDLEASLNIDEVMANYEKVNTLMNELLELLGADDSEDEIDGNDIIDEMQALLESLLNAENLEDVETSVQGLIDLLEELQQYLDQVSSNSDAIRSKISELATALEELSDSMNLKEVKENTERISRLISDLEKMIDENSSTNSPVLEEKIEDLESASDNLDKALNDDGMSANYDKVVAATNNLGSALENLSTESEKVKESIEDVTSELSDKLENVTDQIDRMSATMKNVEEGVQLTLEDISADDTHEDTVGKVYKCTNYGDVSGDLNIGGIAGVMAEENDLDDKEDTKIYGEESVNITGQVRVVIRECDNYGTIRAGKQYVGGIVGYMLIGAVLDSYNAGSIDALNADYVGGIAGNSNAVVRGCSSKCILAGDVYVGGIVGQGKEVTDCYSFTDIQGYTEKAGAIIGDARELPEGSEEDIVQNNYYYTNGMDIGGIDGVSYSGATDKKNLGEFLDFSNIPVAMKTVEVRFVVENQEDIVYTLNVGDSLTMEQVPTISVEADSEYEWEFIPAVTSEILGMGEVAAVEYLSEDSISNILFNQTYEVSFDLKDTVIGSVQRNENKLSIALAEGTFAKNTILELEDMLLSESEINGAEVVENWNVSISKPGVNKLHYLVSENIAKENVKLYIKDTSGKWVEREFVVDGSYIIFDFADGETGFAMQETAGENVILWILLVVIFAVVFLSIVVIRKKNKKK